MNRAFRYAALIAVPLALTACNETSSRSSSNGGLFGSSGGGLFSSGSDVDGRYARNGRCDDPRYNTSNGGRAEAGTDDYDCSRYGDGLKR